MSRKLKKNGINILEGRTVLELFDQNNILNVLINNSKTAGLLKYSTFFSFSYNLSQVSYVI